LRTIRIFGSTVALALALTGLAGGSSASATTVCKAVQATCVGGNIYPAGTEYTGTLVAGTDASIVGAAFEIKCTASTIIGKFSSGSASPLLGEITTWTFGGTCEKCTSMTAIHLNLKAELEKVAGNNGNLTLKNGGGGKPAFKLTGCPMGTTCVYDAEAVGASYIGGQPARVLFKDVPLVKETGNFLCDIEAVEFSAEYKITSLKEPGGMPVNNPPVYVEG
jgi:hypothetical protein